MFGLIIIASMVAFGGIIALLGDRVGMRVGKKRLSLFGLRPKHTSMIITVLTGFFIAGLTLLFLTLMSEYARNAIFRLQTIQLELKSATGKVQQLSAEIIAKEEQYNKLHQSLLEAKAQQLKVEKQLEETKIQYQKTSSNLRSTKEELSLAQSRLNNLTKINDDLKEQIADSSLQKARLSQEIQNLQGWLMSEQDRNQTIVDKPMIFYVGEIITAKVVDTKVKSDKIFDEIVEPLLKDANDLALKRGGRIPGKTDYALRAAPKKIAEVCASLSKTNDQVVLRVVVEKNSVAGEPVTVRLEYYPNKIIFKEDEVITSIIVSSNTPETELRDKLLSLLIVANNKAIEKGIITDGQNLRNLISIYEVAKTINIIRERKLPEYKVSLSAVSNIFRTDPFRVKFKIESP